ncbi:MAG: hypothetical protein QG646_4231 [Euryarchaeota archaeon]|nr:hypothetical protein [Euryarchaeota archaeon]
MIKREPAISCPLRTNRKPINKAINNPDSALIGGKEVMNVKCQ